MYGQIDLEPLSESERFWVSYQKACCHRRLGQIPEAQEIYRRLAGQKRGGWIARLSRWWLDQIDSRSELQLQISKYDTVLKKLMEDAEQNQNP